MGCGAGPLVLSPCPRSLIIWRGNYKCSSFSVGWATKMKRNHLFIRFYAKTFIQIKFIAQRYMLSDPRDCEVHSARKLFAREMGWERIAAKNLLRMLLIFAHNNPADWGLVIRTWPRFDAAAVQWTKNREMFYSTNTLNLFILILHWTDLLREWIDLSKKHDRHQCGCGWKIY